MDKYGKIRPQLLALIWQDLTNPI